MNRFFQLEVVDVKQETSDAVIIAFAIGNGMQELFSYKPGQYLTLKFNLNGNEVRRSYSLCSSPVLNEPLRVSVKRVKDGLVSNHINDNIKVGDIVEVMPPDGRFYADVSKDNYKTYYLFAAGSGITPILSILRSVLLTEEKSSVYMIYGNRTQDSIMFKDELEKLQEEYRDRLILVHALSQSKSGWLAKKPKMEFRKGRVDAQCVEWFVNEYPSNSQDLEYYICGPGTMIENAKKALQSIDVPVEQIFIESFGDGIEAKSDVEKGVSEAKLIAHLDDEEVELTIPKDKTILRTLLDNGFDPPYSCEGGVCSTCICKMTQGSVHMRNNVVLTDEEIKDGYILSCQSIPTSELIEVDFDE